MRKKAENNSDIEIISRSLREASRYAKKLAEQTGTKFVVRKPNVKSKKRKA